MAQLRDTKGRFLSLDMKGLVTRGFGKKMSKSEAGRLGGKASAKARSERKARQLSQMQKRQALRSFTRGAGAGQALARARSGLPVSPALRAMRALRRKVRGQFRAKRARRRWK